MKVQNAYGELSYRPDSIPEQADQKRIFNQGIVGRFANARLPWGKPSDVVPVDLFYLSKFQGVGRYSEIGETSKRRFDNSSIRYIKPGLFSQVLLFLAAYGVAGVLVYFPVTLFIILAVENQKSLDGILKAYIDGWLVFGVVPLSGLLCLILCLMLLKIFPRLSNVEVGGRYAWELNRVSGLVSCWVKDKERSKIFSKQYLKVSIPFYEFDAWVETRGDKVGPKYRLFLSHRYSKLKVNVGAMIPDDRTPNQSYALWDFIQNYMDVSRPLPDVPKLEPCRSLDPTTIESDRAIGRDVNHWRNMSEKDFHSVVGDHAMAAKTLFPLDRYNIMVDKVQYYYKIGQ